jgi:hypothetical protein
MWFPKLFLEQLQKNHKTRQVSCLILRLLVGFEITNEIKNPSSLTLILILINPFH